MIHATVSGRVEDYRLSETERGPVLNLRIRSDHKGERSTLLLCTLWGHKATAVTVEVHEPVGGTWTVLRATHPWVKTEAFGLQFAPAVAPDGEATVNYRVRVEY